MRKPLWLSLIIGMLSLLPLPKAKWAAIALELLWTISQGVKTNDPVAAKEMQTEMKDAAEAASKGDFGPLTDAVDKHLRK